MTKYRQAAMLYLVAGLICIATIAVPPKPPVSHIFLWVSDAILSLIAVFCGIAVWFLWGRK